MCMYMLTDGQMPLELEREKKKKKKTGVIEKEERKQESKLASPCQ